MPEPVLILCGDLFFAPQLHNQAKAAGFATRTALTSAQAVGLLEREPYSAVVIDLELPQLDLSALRQASSTHPACRLIGFAPHVHEDLFAGAKQQGCQELLTRGQASRQLATVLNQTQQE